MGMIWRFEMPLLTTLAALVIIVNCIEDDLETNYRHDLRPRELDTGTPDHAWRAIEETPVAHEPRDTEDWHDNSPIDKPKRRRLGRKRKRRPQTSPEEDLPQERFAYPDEPPRPYYDVDSEIHKTTEMPKRRRKKPEQRPVRWTDDDVMLVDRPLRRRAGLRRKRPSLDAWPEVSEYRQFADVQKDNFDEIRGKVEDQTEPYDRFRDNVHDDKPHRVYENDRAEDAKLGYLQPFVSHAIELSNNKKAKRVHDDDKSLSEFSSEFTEIRAMQDHDRKTLKEKYDDKERDDNNAQDENNADPITLKDILKRSNGTSLSEILQQHNLSLTDLLRGKEQAVSIFKKQEFAETQEKNSTEQRHDLPTKEIEYKTDRKQEESEEQIVSKDAETKYTTEPVTECTTTEAQPEEEDVKETEVEPTTTAKPLEAHRPKISRRRYPTNVPKKMRMRPVLNVTNSYKGQLSRDLVAMNTRKFLHQRRNTSKSREWKDVVPSMQNRSQTTVDKTPLYETTTVVMIPEEQTVSAEVENNNNPSDDTRSQVDTEGKLDDVNMDVTESIATVTVAEVSTAAPKNITEKLIGTMARPTVMSSGLRRQAFNNRLKRKRLKQKNATTEPPQDDLIKHLFGIGNLVSSSEFIARTQDPRSTIDDSKGLSTIDDFITTESTIETDETTYTKIVPTTIVTYKSVSQSTTEETAKKEIEEILNDSQTSAKLSRILIERNMTLNELVEHRERGSSHIHLADIFHNASREPNPPEPFLSKSLIEPISKETYPLRAILEANLHEPNGKATTIDPNYDHNSNIPVVMDYGNNVNENAENMGIMSLFNNFTKNMTKDILPTEADTTRSNHHQTLPDDRNDTVPVTTNVNITNRESRVLGEIEDDVVSWNEIFSLMGNTHNNMSHEETTAHPLKNIALDDIEDDRLIILEDLQHLKDFDNHIALGTDERLEVNEKKDTSHHATGIFHKIPNHTKSVTIATASIAGLAMVLFLLTYAAFKWKQQRSVLRKKRSFCDERIPTPVFENRKGHKNNCSTRSMSPMLQTSNIYTLNTLDSHNGKESPDYMWDSLRKPFQ